MLKNLRPKQLIQVLLPLICLPQLMAPAFGANDSVKEIRLTANPPVVQPINGKLPTSVALVVSPEDEECSKLKIDLSNATIRVTGFGLTLSDVKAGVCGIFAKLTIDPSVPAGKYEIIALQQDKPIGKASFSVLDAAAGPIPPGLPPQVDVMWSVLSQKVCNDVFGKRVARNFYCIELKLGNNTGHPIQLAGIGFTNHVDKLPDAPSVILANTSYASTRAVLLRESVLSPRNVFYHSVQAAGLIMAGGIPYFHAPNPTAHYATAVSLVSGPLLQAINIISPDRVVGQLNNLDDESFRDSQIVPNNTQVRTIVFVEKRALTEQLAAVGEKLLSEKQDVDSESKKTGHLKKGTQDRKTDSDKSTSDGSAPSEKNPQTGVLDVGTLRQTVESQIQQTKKNSTQSDTKFLFTFSTGEFSPLLVKLALGNLVVIGDEIEYLQRVQVQGTPAGGVGSLVTMTPLQLDFGNQNVGAVGSPQKVTISNSQSAALTDVSLSITGTNKDDFSQDNTCGSSLAAGANCAVNVKFTPSAAGVRGASLVLTHTGGTQSVNLTGVGLGPSAGLNISPAPLPAFSSTKVGAPSSVQNVMLSNASTVPVTALQVSVGGTNAADFSVASTCGSGIDSGANCTVGVTFKPTATGARVANLSIQYTLGGANLSSALPLQGTGAAP